jgi:hypothetical protein
MRSTLARLTIQPMPGSSRVLLEPSPPRADESAALAASSARTSSRNCVRRRLW